MAKITCPSCGHTHEINLGSIAASARWAKIPAKKRSQMMSELSRKKKLSTLA